MMEEDKNDLNENFLSRWSKKKSKQKSEHEITKIESADFNSCLLYTSPSPRDLSTSRMPSSA